MNYTAMELNSWGGVTDDRQITIACAANGYILRGWEYVAGTHRYIKPMVAPDLDTATEYMRMFFLKDEKK